MKKVFVIFSLYAMTFFNTEAQITFQKIIGDTLDNTCVKFARTFDNGYIMPGLIQTNGDSTHSASLTKLDSLYNIAWVKAYDGPVAQNFHVVTQTSDSGYIAAGTCYGSYPLSLQAYVVRTNPYGDTLWTRTYGDSSSEEAVSVIQTTDNGFLIVCSTNSFGAGNFHNLYVLKTDANGNLIWSKILGGYDHDSGYSVKQTADSGFIICGGTQNYGAGNGDIWVVKMDGNGVLQWIKTIGTTGYDYGYDVILTNDGGYLLCGYFQVKPAIVKLDASGNVSWGKTYVPNAGFGRFYFVKQLPDNGFICDGIGSGFGFGINDIYVVRTDSAGNLTWSKNYGGTGDEVSWGAYETNDGGFFISGITRGSFGYNTADIYLIKTDTDGNSGCNEMDPNTIVNTPAFTTTSPTITPSSNATAYPSTTTVGNASFSFMDLCLSTSLAQAGSSTVSLNLFPNPATGELNIEGVSGKTEITIYNTIGEKILSKEFDGGEIKLDVKNLAPGIYVVKVAAGDKVFVKKVVKG